MKTIGLIGGMSWESSLDYYRIINETVKARLGGLHSAECIMLSIDFHGMELLQQQRNWAESAVILADAARSLEKAGADCIVLCTNTMHIVADEIQASVQVPFLHIADPTARKVQAAGIKRIGLLGTRFTMEEDFYKGRLERNFGLQVTVPDAPGREVVHRVIYEELVLGNLRQESRAQFLQIIAAHG